MYNKNTTNSSWIAMSDFFCTMMMIFMLLTVTLLQNTSKISDRNKAQINSYKTQLDISQAKINDLISDDVTHSNNILIDRIHSLVNDLRSEFKDDLPTWNAEILDDTTFRFLERDTLFTTGKAELNQRFKLIINSFIPRYIAILNQPQFKPYIKEIRIEGHTSSIWNNHTGEKQAYLLNMQLSQERTMNTLNYIINLPSIEKYYEWIHDKVTANGFASSHPLVKDITSTENQRVEFKVNLNRISKKLYDDLRKALK